MKTEIKWASDEEWRHAGPRLYTLEGLFRAQPGSEDTLTQQGAMLVASYEAKQHLLHFGRANTPVCCTIYGLMSGDSDRLPRLARRATHCSLEFYSWPRTCISHEKGVGLLTAGNIGELIALEAAARQTSEMGRRDR